jgi:uncharacterized protein YbjT (DUF2867 family)
VDHCGFAGLSICARPVRRLVMNVLVVGATGQVGAEIVRLLLAKGHRVRALARPTSPKREALERLGADVRRGDLRDRPSLDAACDGCEAVISTATAITAGGAGNTLAAVDQAGYENLVAAAKAKGVRRFIFTSTSPKYGASPLLQSKRATERVLRESGLEYTILQPSLFMEIWFGPAVGWNLEAGKAQLFGRGDAPISWISLRDVAAYAVAVLDEPKAKNQEIPLGGPEAISARDALATIERTLGKRFKVTRLPAFMPTVASAVLKPFNPKLASLMALGTETLSGDAIDLQKARAIAEVPLTSLAQWVQQSRV